VAVIVVDELLRGGSARRYSLPPLAVGMGIYLPMEVTLLVPVGALIGWLYNRWADRAANPAFAERLGTLMATGLIVGESLMGVAYAGIVASAEKAGSTDSANVLALIAAYPQVMLVSVLVFALAIVGLYAWTRRRAAVPPVVGDGLAPAEATFR
jgi:hypothetical protein